jgi:hypothetical protein
MRVAYFQSIILMIFAVDQSLKLKKAMILTIRLCDTHYIITCSTLCLQRMVMRFISTMIKQVNMLFKENTKQNNSSNSHHDLNTSTKPDISCLSALLLEPSLNFAY